MSANTPFTTTPPSQYRRPEFYWRGGDPLKEREYLIDEYKKAMIELKKAQMEHRQMEEQVQEAEEVLREREGYTNALADFLEGDSKASREEADLKKEAADLERQIKESREELAQLRERQNPLIQAQLNKERSYLLVEIQRANQGVVFAKNRTDEAKRQLAACVVNQRYRNGIELQEKELKAIRKQNRLKKEVKQTKSEQAQMKAGPVLVSDDSRDERSKWFDIADGKLRLIHERGRLARKPQKQKREIEFLIAQIEELNERMAEIGMGPDEQQDVVDLRSRYLPQEEQDPDGQSETSDQKSKEEPPKNEDLDDDFDDEFESS